MSDQRVRLDGVMLGGVVLLFLAGAFGGSALTSPGTGTSGGGTALGGTRGSSSGSWRHSSGSFSCRECASLFGVASVGGSRRSGWDSGRGSRCRPWGLAGYHRRAG